jgi:hypothetical protein
MIDIIDKIIECTQTDEGLGGRVYREYPAINALDGLPFAVVAHSGHGTLNKDERGSEIMAQLAYTVRIYGKELEQVDCLSDALINIYNSMGIDISSYSTAYNEPTETHFSTIGLSCKADRRGATYR